MEYTVANDGAAQLFKITGNWTFQDHNLMKELIDKINGGACILDMSAVEFIDSAGLGMLITAREKIADKGGFITLRGVEGAVRRIMDLARFDELFTIE